MACFCSSGLLPTTIATTTIIFTSPRVCPLTMHFRRPKNAPSIAPKLIRHELLARASPQDDDYSTTSSAPNLDVSVFRFTLGIPGFDDSELPRIMGFCFGALLLLNHFLTADVITGAQLRSEAVGFFLAVFSINLPTIGKSLKGTRSTKVATLMSSKRQVFVLANNLSEAHREELAWGSYALLRNTNTLALAIWYEGLLCARGCWEIPKEAEEHVLGWLEAMLKKTTFYTTETTFYLPSNADNQGWKVVPKGAVCLLAQPFGASCLRTDGADHQVKRGLVVLLSNVSGAYNEKDRAWIASLTDKLSKILVGIKT